VSRAAGPVSVSSRFETSAPDRAERVWQNSNGAYLIILLTAPQPSSRNRQYRRRCTSSQHELLHQSRNHAARRSAAAWRADKRGLISLTSPPMRVSRGAGQVRGELTQSCMDRHGEVAGLAFGSMAARRALVPTPRRLRGRILPAGAPT